MRNERRRLGAVELNVRLSGLTRWVDLLGLTGPLKQGERAHGDTAHKRRRSRSVGLRGEQEVGGAVDWRLRLKAAPASPPGPLRIKPECSSGTVMQKHRTDGRMDGGEKEKSRMKAGEKKEERERQTHKNTMRDYICSSSDGALLD